MTTPLYPMGWPARSKARGEAAAAWSASSAWVVYFDDGYVGGNHRDDGAFVRAVRSVSAAPAGQ